MGHRIRLGIVGCGVIGQYHLRSASASSLIDVVAVADLRDEVAKSTAQQFRVPQYFGNGEALIAGADVDAIVLAMPTAGRFDLALLALDRKRHVLLEKPAAMNVGQIKQLIMAQGTCVVGSCSSRNRALKSAKVATEWVASGRLGDIRVLHCRAITPVGPISDSPPPNWRLKKSINGGGVFVNWGSYDLDFLLGICGWALQPRLVLAQTWNVAPYFVEHTSKDSDAEVHVAAMIRCENGTVIHYERGELAASPISESWQIMGSQGALRLNLHPANGNQVIFDTADAASCVRSEVLWEGDETDETTHAGPVTNFASAILGQHKPRTGLEQAMIIQAITDAVYLSAKRGCAVEIEPSFDIRPHKATSSAEI